APRELSPLALHDALPILSGASRGDERRAGHGQETEQDRCPGEAGQGNPRSRLEADPGALHPGGKVESSESAEQPVAGHGPAVREDRKSTRLNSSHVSISY